MTERGVIRLLGVALLGSLCLNLLLGGFVVGREFLHPQERPAPPAAPPPVPAPAGPPAPVPTSILARVQLLPADERQRFRQVVRPYQPGIAAARAAHRAAQAELAAALRAAPYDKEAVRAAFARVRETGAHAQDLAQQAAVEGFAALSQPAREALATPPAR